MKIKDGEVKIPCSGIDGLTKGIENIMDLLNNHIIENLCINVFKYQVFITQIHTEKPKGVWGFIHVTFEVWDL